MRQRNIAIDARWAVRRTNGIGQYILQLALRLPLLAPDTRFTLLVDRALDCRGLPHGCSQAVLGTYLGDGTPAARCYSPFWLNYEVPRYLRHHRIDLFHGANFVIPRFASCPAVTTVHDMAVFRIPHAFGPVYRRYMRWQISSAVRRAEAVVTVSESTRNDMVELLDVPAGTIQVAHCGVDGCYREHHPN
jgi:glycosyltransferase involved in cell wall biosynthesis